MTSASNARTRRYDGVIDIRTANEVLDRMKSLMPGALTGPDEYLHHADDRNEATH